MRGGGWDHKPGGRGIPCQRWKERAFFRLRARAFQASLRAVAIMSKPMSRRSCGVLRIIAENSRAFISGGVSFTAKPVPACLSDSMRLAMF